MELPATALHWILVAAAAGAVSFFCVGLTTYFERRDDKPRWVGAMHDTGALLTATHVALVFLFAPRSEASAIAGIVMYVLAISVMLATIEAADRNRTRLQRSFVDHPLPDRLITHGPYRFVRHPFYLSYIIGAIAPAVAVPQPLVIAVTVLMIVLVVAAAFREERVWLSSPRAEAYQDYRRRTGMFLPFVGRG